MTSKKPNSLTFQQIADSIDPNDRDAALAGVKALRESLRTAMGSVNACSDSADRLASFEHMLNSIEFNMGTNPKHASPWADNFEAFASEVEGLTLPSMARIERALDDSMTDEDDKGRGRFNLANAIVWARDTGRTQLLALIASASADCADSMRINRDLAIKQLRTL